MPSNPKQPMEPTAQNDWQDDWEGQLKEMLDIFLKIPGKNLFFQTDIVPFVRYLISKKP